MKKIAFTALACLPLCGGAAAQNTTFATLIDNALYVEGGAEAYKPFTDSQIKVYKVTSLNREGEGSLAWAVERKEPRIVVFEVGGVIDLDGATLKICNPYLYIAGQSAPSPGITLIRGEISIQSHDVVIRHIAVRPGDNGQPRKSGWEKDCMSTWKAWNVLVDHCSCTWATDEGLSASGPRHEGRENTSRCITLSNNIISEPVNDGPHSKGPHGYGTLVHDYCTGVGIVGNLYASNRERAPLLKPNSEAYVANNLIYNPARRGIHGSMIESEYEGRLGEMNPAMLAAIGNVAITGPDTPSNFYLIFGAMTVYQSDNVILNSVDDPKGDRTKQVCEKNIPRVDELPFDAPNYKPIASTAVAASVMRNVGARPWSRSPIDSRIIDRIAARNGRMIDSQSEVGGYPANEAACRPLTVPATGLEQWVNAMACQAQ
jgi:hypothetical protein